MQLSELNGLPEARAREEFLRCCHCENWANEMISRRPFASFDQMLRVAEEVWWQLGPSDWRQAFSAHPKIGDIDSLRQKYAASRNWSQGEQSGVNGADENTLSELASGNREYEEKFGYIFIVCATGKSAAEMLHILQSRLSNSAEDEIKIAAAEQLKITRIRLEKLCPAVQSQPTS